MDIDILLHKFFENTATEKEITEVLNWLEADSANRKYLNELDYIHNMGLLAKVRNKQMRLLQKTIPAWRRVVTWSARIAAILAVCLVISFSLANRIIERKSELTTTITVPNGQRINITLQDGSDVWLNSGATLEYPAVFSDKARRVKIDGEAVFHVRKSPEKVPFIVETYICDVEVLGTEFSVNAKKELDKFTVDLLKGSVKVVNKQVAGENVILRPNETVKLVNGKLRLETSDEHDNLLWVDGIFNVTGLTFEEVIAKFEQYYDVKIVVECEKLPQIKFQKCKIRISDGIEHAIRVLQYSADFNYYKDTANNVIIIR